MLIQIVINEDNEDCRLRFLLDYLGKYKQTKQ